MNLGKFISLRFPEDLGTNDVPNYIRFTPQQVKYGGTRGLYQGTNGVSAPGGSVFSNSTALTSSNALNPIQQIQNQIGGAVDSFANGANELVDSINGIFNTASLSTSLTNLGRVVSGRVNIGNFVINFGQQTNPDTLFTIGSINLFLPDQLGTKSGVNFSAEELGTGGLAAVESVRSSAQDDLSVNNVDTLVSGILQQSVLGQQGITKSVIAVAQNRVTNNFSYQIFQGVGHRNFTYQFRMVPKDTKEANEIKKICDMFLYYMLPSRLSEGQSDMHFYEIPAQWKIDYMRQGNKLEFHQQPFACFLQSVDVQYGGDSKNFLHTDGSPAEVTLNLEFVEIEPLYRTRNMTNSFGKEE